MKKILLPVFFTICAIAYVLLKLNKELTNYSYYLNAIFILMCLILTVKGRKDIDKIDKQENLFDKKALILLLCLFFIIFPILYIVLFGFDNFFTIEEKNIFAYIVTCTILTFIYAERKVIKFMWFYFSGSINLYKKNYEKALDKINKAIKISPNSCEAYFNRGFCEFYLEKYQEAMEDCNKSLSLNPQFVHAYCLRGDIYGRLENYQKAIEDYSKAIKLKSPLMAELFLARGVLKKEIKDFQGALADIEQSLDICTKNKNTKAIKRCEEELQNIKKIMNE